MAAHGRGRPDEANGAGLVLVQEIFGVGAYVTAVALTTTFLAEPLPNG